MRQFRVTVDNGPTTHYQGVQPICVGGTSLPMTGTRVLIACIDGEIDLWTSDGPEYDDAVFRYYRDTMGRVPTVRVLYCVG